MRLNKKWGVALILLVIISGVLLFQCRTGFNDDSVGEFRAPVYVVSPEKRDLETRVKITGYVESESMVTVLPKISGSLVSLNVEMGDRVTKGELLAQVDPEPFELQLKQAQAAYLAAKSTYERIKTLHDQRAVSRQNFEEVRAQYEAAGAQFELAQLQVRYTRILSPVDGVVLVKHSSVGALVAPQVPLVTLGDLRNLVVKARIPERYYNFFLGAGEKMDIRVRVPAMEDRTFSAGIDRISPYITPETKNFEVVCRLEGDLGALRPGMFIYLDFVLSRRENALSLPNEVLVGGEALWFLEISGQVPRAFKRAHDPLYVSDEGFEVPKEWSEKFFITEGQHFLRDGQPVRVLNKEVSE